MALASSVRTPHSLLISHSMILSVRLWFHTHIQNARAEGAIRISKEHVRCLLHGANLSRCFWSDVLCHFCLLYVYCPDVNGLSVWENLDSLQLHQMCHNLVKDLHVFGSYVTGHLPHEHPHLLIS